MDLDIESQALEMRSNLSDSEMVDENTSHMSDSSEECAPVSRVKKRLPRFVDSGSDTDKEYAQVKNKSSESEHETTNKISTTQEGSTSEDDTGSDSDKKTIKNEEQQLRMKNKRNKLRNKFKTLVTSRSKEVLRKDSDSENEYHQSYSREEFHDESSINNIKQEIKKSMSFKPSICDPDTSDEEEIDDKSEKVSKSLNRKKSTKPTSPKPLRMSAKQAMENMQKIKSESNRLLREKEVTLPYHRPKAFSLKDIMSRRKPAVTADGKALPIKMNGEQLKQYAQMLEQRQKEIMDLCKSDSDEEQDNSTEIVHEEKPESTVNIASESLENNLNHSTNLLVDNFSADSEPAQIEDTQKLYETSKCLDLNDHNTTELDNSSNIEMKEKSSVERDKTPNNSNLNRENGETDSLDNTLTKKNIIEEIVTENMDTMEKPSDKQTAIGLSESESQILNLYYNSENTVPDKLQIIDNNVKSIGLNKSMEHDNKLHENNFSDDDIDMDDIDKLIENAEIVTDVSSEDNGKSSILSVATTSLFTKPKLTGAPGMVIDLDDNDTTSSKKLSGVELLKERFTYFAKLKTPEELEREREKKSKPGAQHLKLKQELEEIIAEQRSLEWAKRLNDEKQQQMELKALRGDESDAEDDIEKIEAQIEENDVDGDVTSEEAQSEPEEDDLGEIKEKPRIKNPMIDDEAEESDCDDEDIEEKHTDIKDDDNDVNKELDEGNDVSCEDQTSEESSDDESEEETSKPRKGRILKAFEDSDDETGNETRKNTDRVESVIMVIDQKEQSYAKDKITAHKSEIKETIISNEKETISEIESQVFKDSQDDEIQLAQWMESASDDIFTSQESMSVAPRRNSQGDDDQNILGTQTFSILNTSNNAKDVPNLESTQKSSIISGTPTLERHLDAAIGVSSGGFTQNLIPSHLSSSQQPIDQSQAIGEDVLALCTGNFYDNQFISQSEQNKNGVQEAVNDSYDDSWSKDESQRDETDIIIDSSDKLKDNELKNNKETKDNDKLEGKAADQNLLQSIIDELHDDDKIDSLKPNKYFVNKNTNNDTNNQVKKKFVIESDDELNEDKSEQNKKKKVKKKRLEQRALQISDDEEDESDDAEEYLSELENDTERIVEYDSEENEIEMKPENTKKKRKVADFFENEAELTSEDEWVGSGDEDERDLDRMEREEGDDETFHQGRLQRELGQIHMRDVLDQDKREVRLIQELLFEDGDLGDGHRQRKFRWRNEDGAEEADTIVDDFADTQEEEFESEEQWRKQRHEREVFLRQMKEQDKNEDTPNITLNRSTIIKANLSSKTMSSLLSEVNNTTTKTDQIVKATIKEKYIKDVPSPKKGFTILQQNYHSSLLTRGRGALARLAALATPLAIDEDSTKVATVAPKNQRNFVFAAVTKEAAEPKVMKRKADNKLDTPRLVKKLKTNEKRTLTRNSLLDHLRI